MKQDFKKYLLRFHEEKEILSWYSSISFFVNDGNHVEVSTPHSYFSQWFKNNFEKNLIDFLLQQGKTKISVAYQCNHVFKKKRFIGNQLNIPKSDYPFGRDFSFLSFLYNKKNSFPYLLAKEVAQLRENKYNPFVICGGPGSGKTHLIKAIANDISHNYRKKNIFMGDVDKIQHLFSFDKKIRRMDVQNYLSSLDAVFIEDIQDFKKNPSLEEEVLSIFESLLSSKKQIICTYCGSFSDMSLVIPQLHSHISLGLTVNLDPPDLDLRIKYIQNQCKNRQVSLNKDQIFTLSQKFHNFRQLNGVILKMHALQSLMNDHIDDHWFRQVVEGMSSHPVEPLTVDAILAEVSGHFTVSPKDIMSSKRQKTIVLARQISMTLCRDMLGYSLPKIGHIFGGRDHSTVLHSIQKINRLLVVNTDVNELVMTLKDRCLKKG